MTSKWGDFDDGVGSLCSRFQRQLPEMLFGFNSKLYSLRPIVTIKMIKINANERLSDGKPVVAFCKKDAKPLV